MQKSTKDDSMTRAGKLPTNYQLKSVYASLLIALLAFASGAVFASVALGNNFDSSPNQSQSNFTANEITGLNFNQTSIQIAGASSPVVTGSCAAANLGTAGSPTSLTLNATKVICLSGVGGGGYAASDSIQTITVFWGNTAAHLTAYSVQVAIVTNAGTSSFQAYVKTTASPGTNHAFITFDLTAAGATSVTSLNIIVSQCSGATCP